MAILQILMMAKMSKTEISAEIQKRKNQNQTKRFSAQGQSKVLPLNQT